MNAIDILKEDHHRVRVLSQRYHAAAGRAFRKKKDIADQVFRALELHTKLEEEIFYPAVRAKASPEGQDLVDESIEAHKEVDALIAELQDIDPGDPDFEDRFEELIEAVEHHIEQEEEHLFPEAEARLGDELETIATELEEEKEMAATE